MSCAVSRTRATSALPACAARRSGCAGRRAAQPAAGTEIVTRPQAMTRHSRGTQLSIIGWRQIPLCRTCDANALEASIAENTPVPGTYVSACLHAPGDTPTPTPAESDALPRAAQSAAIKHPAPTTPAPSKPVRATAATARPGSETSTHRQRKAAQRPTHSRPAAGSVPTVRQAIAAVLAEASGEVDHTAMLLLGTHLGSYNRLGVLEGDEAADALADWVDGHWSDRGGAGGQRAIDTIRRAIDFSGARGWLASDPAASLR
jgi:hypothetical protein